MCIPMCIPTTYAGSLIQCVLCGRGVGKPSEGSVMFCFTVFGMVEWASEENHFELTCDKESNMGFIVHAGSSNAEVNMDMIDFTSLFKMH